MSHTTLGPARGRATEEELNATQTIFGRFLLALRPYITTDQPVVGEAVMWCDEPIDQVVLSGISVLLRSFASQIGMEMRTATQARQVAERLNRRLSAGILIHYQTPETAAKAFYEQVILRLRRAHVLGYRPGMSLALSAWSALAAGQESDFVRALPKGHDPSTIGDLTEYYAGPATVFLAPLLKSARELKQRLTTGNERLHRLNTIGSHHEIVRSEGARYASYAALAALGYLDETQWGPIKVPDGFLHAHKVVAEAIALCEIMAAFEMDFTDWSQSVVHLDQEWLCTQILLAFTSEATGVDIIPNLEIYQVGLRAVLAESDHEVVAATCVRLKSRLIRELSPTQWERLKVQLRDLIKRIRGWNPDAIDDKMLSGVIIKVSEKEFLLDPKMALQVALGKEDALLDHVRDQGLDLFSWLTNVGFAIVWAMLDEEEVLAIIEAEVLPDEIIVDNLSQCEEEVRQTAIAAMLEREVSAKTLNLFLMLGLVTLTPKLFGEHVDVIDPKILGRELETMLEHAVTPYGETIWRALIKAMVRAPVEAVHALFEDSVHRVELCSIGVELLQQVEVDWVWYDQLRNRLGDEFYRMWLLGSLASERQMLREDASGEVDAWENTFQGGDISFTVRLLGSNATQETAQALLREITEDVALAWAGLTS